MGALSSRNREEGNKPKQKFVNRKRKVWLLWIIYLFQHTMNFTKACRIALTNINSLAKKPMVDRILVESSPTHTFSTQNSRRRFQI
mmetsp:Transcript_18881/g.21311  ORF Transcript_18881/g.21311 Transcript_18881/m.21311 type:complete len:86 (-) Transcript_18881:1175-1432(-)